MSKSKQFICGDCGDTFPTIEELTNHRDEHVTKKQAVSKPQDTEEKGKEKRHVCKICGKDYKYRQGLERHHRSRHTNERPHKCKLCGKGFAEAYLLKRHLRDCQDIRPYKCKVCGDRFKRKIHLERHLRGHTGEKPFICTVCGDRFRSKHHLTRHQRIHDNEKPYICEVCGDAFRQKHHLKEHMMLHTGDRPYICEICERRFIKPYNLTIHVRNHTGELPYKCTTCKRGFTNSGSLRKHQEAEACWYTYESFVIWEKLCKKIAEILLGNLSWEWKPRIDTPDIKERKYITPEVLVKHAGGTIEFIDAKRSVFAVTYKDLVIYPKYADKLTFWCLYGESKEFEIDGTRMTYYSAEDLIFELTEKKDKKNESYINELISKIYILKKGLNPNTQSKLEEFLESEKKF
ncbi:MAG: C2H2-type zinc finger protein [Promethearchaeota archaeon]